MSRRDTRAHKRAQHGIETAKLVANALDLRLRNAITQHGALSVTADRIASVVNNPHLVASLAERAATSVEATRKRETDIARHYASDDGVREMTGGELHRRYMQSWYADNPEPQTRRLPVSYIGYIAPREAVSGVYRAVTARLPDKQAVQSDAIARQRIAGQKQNGTLGYRPVYADIVIVRVVDEHTSDDGVWYPAQDTPDVIGFRALRTLQALCDQYSPAQHVRKWRDICATNGTANNPPERDTTRTVTAHTAHRNEERAAIAKTARVRRDTVTRAPRTIAPPVTPTDVPLESLVAVAPDEEWST